MNATQTPRFIRFGPFEADLHTRELRKHGLRLKLQEQPFQVLTMLLARPGELVTREEIQSTLWAQDRFVDFDHSLNAAVRRLRDALNDNAETPRFIETLPRRGYRFIAPVEQPSRTTAIQAETVRLSSPAVTTVEASERAAASAPTLPELRPKSAHPSVSIPSFSLLQTTKIWQIPNWAKLLATILIVALIAGAIAAYELANKKAKQPAIRSLAVLPLQNISGDPAQQYLADGITEELIGRLAEIRDLRVISRTSVMRFKNTQLSVPEIARTLAVDAVLEGSVMREGSRIRVHAQFIRAASDEHLWSESYDRELRDVLAMDADVAQAVARKVRVTISGQERERLVTVHPVSPEVYENYLKGKFALARSNSKSNIEESINYFNEAIKKDPTYAPSYLGLAAAYNSLTTVFMGGIAEQQRPRAMLAAQKALELDPELADAHVLVASIAESQWHWADAENEYRRALELRPNDAAAYSGLAWWLDCQGRPDEAVTMRRRARELDPLVISGTDLAWDLFYTRHYEEAVQELRSVLAVRADDAYALWVLGFTLIANHQPQDAVPGLEKGVSASHRSPALIGLLVNAYAQAGRRREALRLLEELKRRKQTGYVPSAAFVLAYLGLGANDQTFAWLEQAYREQSNIMQLLKVFPFFDPIRNDPRFIDLLHRVGLDQPN